MDIPFSLEHKAQIDSWIDDCGHALAATPPFGGTHLRSASHRRYNPQMPTQETIAVEIRPWEDGDLGLLQRLRGDPAMNEHLGGPESQEKILERHLRYLKSWSTDRDRMFAIVVGPQKLGAGSIGYWELEWHDQVVWETGWGVLPDYQGRGIATRASILTLERARAEGRHRFMHAFPSIDNAASNAVCQKVGFVKQGEADFEFPKDHWMRCNDWCLDLQAGNPAVR